MSLKPKHPGIILGSYAAFPPANEEGSLSQIEFQNRVRELAHVTGLEIPFTKRGLLNSSMGLTASEQLAFGWQVIATFLPCQMENMEINPRFGLASVHEASRVEACVQVKQMLSELGLLLKSRRDLKLLAIAIHSGPRGAVEGSVAAFKRSMADLQGEAYFHKLVIEHCDSNRGIGPVAKGFLSIFDEMEVAQEFNLGLVVNWGRSAIEGHSAVTPIEHLRLALSEVGGERALLRGLMLSGASTEHPLYGNWIDTHAPIREAFAKSTDLAGDDRLELTLARARQAWLLINEYNLDNLALHPDESARYFLGLKVQPLPREMSVDERIEFLRQHLEMLSSLLTPPPEDKI